MNIPSVTQLSRMLQPIFKKSNGKSQTYGETSKKDLIRICYIFSKEAQNFMKGMEFFKSRFTALLFLNRCECGTCATSWAEYGELFKNEE